MEWECYVKKEVCKKSSTPVCGENCRAYILFEAIYGVSNIPKKYQNDKTLVPENADLEQFRILNGFKKNVVNHVGKGRNVFITSHMTGNGKTTWACKIAHEYIKKSLFNDDIDNLVYYVNVPELLEDLRRGYDDGEYDSILHKLKSSKLVIFDDVGAEKSSEWVRERLYTIINYRVLNGLSSIYTSNLSMDELVLNVGQRVVSRLKEDTLIVELVGKDRRGE